jgi:hypothetical protein
VLPAYLLRTYFLERYYNREIIRIFCPDLKKNVGGSNIINNSKSSSSNNIKSVLPIHTPREALVSAVVAVCERCGVEEIQMASCRQCQKVTLAESVRR